MALTAKRERFCLEYVTDYNGAQAAIRAGYSAKTARTIASELLTFPDIHNRVVELGRVSAEELGITKRRIILKLWDIVEKSYQGAPKTDKGEPIVVTVDGERIVVYDWSPAGATRALELIMKQEGMLVDRVEHEGGVELVVRIEADADLR